MTYLDNVHGIIIGGMNLSTEIECGYEKNTFKTYNILEEDRERKVSLRRAAGAHKIASFLREYGADVEVVDFAFMWKLEELKDLWKSRYHSKTLFLGISTTFHQASGYLWQFVEWIREKYPHITIIGGTLSIDKLLGFYCDWYVYGYGEFAALELVKAIKDGTTSKIIHHNINGKKIINANINYKSFPKKDLTVRYEDRDFIQPHEVLDLEFSRGCIFQCAFCNYPILSVKEDHSRHEDNLYTELLENYERWGTTRYNLADETVNDYHKKLTRYANVVKKLPFKPELQGYARADILVSTKKHWETYVDLGFMSHFYGVESLYHPAAKAIGKGMDSGKLKEGLLEFKEWAYKNNDNGFYTAFMSLIAGLPNETYESLEDGIKWLKTNWYDQFSVMGILQIHMPSAMSLYKDIAKDLGNISLIEKDPEKYGYKLGGYTPYRKLHSKPEVLPYVEKEKWLDKPSTYKMAGQTVNLPVVDGPPIKDTEFLWKDQPINKSGFYHEDFKAHNSWESNTGLTIRGINEFFRGMSKKYHIPDMPTITQGSVASWNQVEFYVDPDVVSADMMKKGPNKHKVNADVLTRLIQGNSKFGAMYGSAGDAPAHQLYYHKKKFLQKYKRDKLNA